MRSPYEALTLLRRSAQELDPRRTQAALNAYIRGGLPATSMSDGRGAAETPDTELDGLDADLVATLEGYEHDLDALAASAAELVRRQRDLLATHAPRPAPKSKEFVYAELKAAADKYDADHDLEIGTTWARQEHQAPPPAKIDWCVSCARTTVNGYPQHVPVADEKRGGKDCTLCWWCLQYTRQHDGKWPPIEFVQARAQGRPVRVKVKP